MIPVSEFLPALVENGLIENVDLHLFGIVCSTVERWRQQYGKEISISVNLNECAFNYEFFLMIIKRFMSVIPAGRTVSSSSFWKVLF